MKRANRKCIVCGTEYEFCDSCGTSAAQRDDMWKALYHDMNCKHIYEALSAYMVGTRTNEEVIKMLSACNFDGIHLKPTMQKAYDEIMELATAPQSKKEEAVEAKSDTQEQEEKNNKTNKVEKKQDDPTNNKKKGVSSLYMNSSFKRVK